ADERSEHFHHRTSINRGSAPDPGSVARGGPQAPLRARAGAPGAPRVTRRPGPRLGRSRGPAGPAPRPRPSTLLRTTLSEVEGSQARRARLASRGRLWSDVSTRL